MRSRFVTLDVFTAAPFAGNPLAVFLDARGIGDERMQQIAREFGFSETTFVVPAERPDCARRVRIFTPTSELPFAGHPTIGTAIALVRDGYIPMGQGPAELSFDLAAGPTPVTVREVDGGLRATLTAPQLPVRGPTTPAPLVAAAVALEPESVDIKVHEPVDVGTGVDYVAVRLASLDALARARPVEAAWQCLPSPAAHHGLALYVLDAGAHELRMRMFAPSVGVVEDPATGSAASALGGLLAELNPTADGTLGWTMRQGIEMGRPSRIDVEADKANGKVCAVRVGGTAVAMTEGWLDLAS